MPVFLDYLDVFNTILDLYGNIVGDKAAVGMKERFTAILRGADGLTQQRKLRQCSFVLEQPTLVIDDAHRLFTKSRSGFDDLIQLLRDPAAQRGSLKVILLSSEMDFEDVVRSNGVFYRLLLLCSFCFLTLCGSLRTGSVWHVRTAGALPHATRFAW